MKTKVFLLLLPCLLFSCNGDVQIEDNRRLLVSGSITGNAPDNISVVTMGAYNMEPDDNPDKILGFGKSNQNGKFSFTSLDTYSHNLLISINSKVLDDYKENMGSYYFYDDSGIHQLSYDLGEINLPQKVSFDFNIENTSGTSDTLYYSFKYENPVKYFVRATNDFEEVEDNSYVTVYEILPLSEPRVHHIDVAAGSDLKFIYNFGDQAAQEITVSVNSETNSYDFEY